MLAHSIVPCPVCGEGAPFAYLHSQARIHRCPACTHAFSNLASVKETEQYSADYYEVAHRNWFANPNLPLFCWIESQLPRTVRLLVDIGCGRGQFLDFMRARRPDVRLVGVDLSPNVDR